MSDSVDRVFVHALATVRRLPRTGSSRPPPSARLRLYGLYKQSMEGDVSAILPRPTLPGQGPTPNDSLNSPLSRYASKELRTKETQAEIEKWDAWNACAGTTRTEAKRRYISTLIETMKEYASGTAESRELVSELEFVWNQIKSQSGSDESESSESPTRKLERSGMKRAEFIDPPGPGRGSGVKDKAGGSGSGSRGDVGGGRKGGSLFGFSRLQRSATNASSSQLSQRQSQSARESGLRVLSPKSPRSADEVVENEEILQISPDAERDSEEDDDQEQYDEDEQQGQSEGSQEQESNDNEDDLYNQIPNSASNSRHILSDTHWRTQIEAHLSRLTLELTALREQLSSNSLLSRSSFSHNHNQSTYLASMPWRSRIYHRIVSWFRWTLYTIIKQFVIHLALLSVVLVYGRWKGDRRLEHWVRARLEAFSTWIQTLNKRRWGLRAF